jgi:hypothetical protein
MAGLVTTFWETVMEQHDAHSRQSGDAGAKDKPCLKGTMRQFDEARRWACTARCGRCGRFARGWRPGYCPGCGAVHCQFCLVADGCEHLLAVAANDTAAPQLIDPVELPTLATSAKPGWQPSEDDLRRLFGRLHPLLSAYVDGLDMPPRIGLLIQILLDTVDHRSDTLDVRFAVGKGTSDDRVAYFSRVPDEARRGVRGTLAELAQAFERLAAVVASDQPHLALDAVAPLPIDLPVRPSPWESLGKTRRRARRSLPPSILLVKCGDERHRVSLPRRGPIVLFDHPDRQATEAKVAQRDVSEGCILVLRYIRRRASYNPFGWCKWSVHVSPRFGPAGWTIRERLKELDRRRTLRRVLRDVDFGPVAEGRL